MPWNNQGGGWQSGNGQGPWGGRPGSGGGNQGGGGNNPRPPDLEEILRKGQEKLRQMFPGGGAGGGGSGGAGGSGGGRGFGNKLAIGIGAAVLVGIWLFSGLYRVQPDERGVELMFGRLWEVNDPGLHYHLPSPIQSVQRPKVERINRVEIGFRSTGGSSREVEGESLMLTGDENIVDINFVVLWKISVPENYLFNIRDPEATVKAAAESVMRGNVAQTPITDVTTEGRSLLEDDVRTQLQMMLENYGAGILITEVQLQKADPPAEVIEAFRDVQRAQADRERLQNEAEAFANDIIPRARGQAARFVQEAEGYREQVVAQANGQAQRFTAVLEEYSKAREVTANRIYLETMETVLGGMNKLVIDGENAGSGVVPYLPLPELQRRQPGSDGGQTTSATGQTTTSGETQ